MTIREQVVWSPEFLPDPQLPARFAEAKPAGIDNGTVREVVDRYVAEFWAAAEQGLAPLLSGRTGQWKTYGAAVVLRYAHWQRLPSRFVECGAFFQRADALFYQKAGLEMLDEIERIPFLVLDDVTQVNPGTRPAELMTNVVATRFAAQRPTLVTLNVPLKDSTALQQLGSMYRPDFARRLMHGSTGFRAVV